MNNKSMFFEGFQGTCELCKEVALLMTNKTAWGCFFYVTFTQLRINKFPMSQFDVCIEFYKTSGEI